MLVQKCTSFKTGKFPLKYLGCPISHKRKTKEYYFDLITRVKSELEARNGNMLFYGGKEVLMNSVLQRVRIHVFSAWILGMIFLAQKKRVVFVFSVYFIYLVINMLNSLGGFESRLFMGQYYVK